MIRIVINSLCAKKPLICTYPLVKYRIDGDLVDIESSPVLNDKMISQMLLEIMTDDQKDELIETYKCDFSIDDRDNDVRFR